MGVVRYLPTTTIHGATDIALSVYDETDISTQTVTMTEIGATGVYRANTADIPNSWGVVSSVAHNIRDLVRISPSAGSMSADLAFIRGIEGGRWALSGTQMVFYAEDNSTEIARVNLLDASGVGVTDPALAVERVRV